MQMNDRERCFTPDYPLQKKKAEEWSLVLKALNIPHTMNQMQKGWVLDVEKKYREKAKREIELYEKENNKRMLPSEAPYFDVNIHGIILVLFLLILFHILTQISNHKIQWYHFGQASASYILKGEWWRAITALTLHADIVHVFSNVLLGGITVAALSRQVGTGTAWFLILFSGIGGNLINAFVHQRHHHAIGASTAVFGAIGILAGLQLSGKYRQYQWKTWITLSAAIALLGFLGTGEHSDLGGHLFGFVTGIFLGIMMVGLLSRFGSPSIYIQRTFALISAIVVVFGWLFALRKL